MVTGEAPVAACALRLTRIKRVVAELGRAEAFYREALGFTCAPVTTTPLHGATPGARAAAAGPNHMTARPDPTRAADAAGASQASTRLSLGGQEIELVCHTPPGAAYPADSTCADLWFQHFAVVTHDIEAAFERLQHFGAESISVGGPQSLPARAGGVRAYKFRDPDGHPVELLEFPPAAGQPPLPPRAGWHACLNRGIDHSAISVSDVRRSEAFYTRVLGLQRSAGQVNSGIEQARLDALPGARVDVSALRPATAGTPHVELLGYRAPRGRPAARCSRVTDVAADRLVFEVNGLAALLGILERIYGNTGWPCVVRPDSSAGSTTIPREALLRDPDGHLLELHEHHRAMTP